MANVYNCKRRPLMTGGLAFIGACLFLWGCATGQYGGLRYSGEVTRMFDQHAVPTNYHYFITGRSELPYAVIGLQPQYQLVGKFWKPVEPAIADSLLLWRPDIWDRFEQPQGAWIVDQQGKKIGIWYSMYPSTTIFVQKDDRVEVYSPYTPGNSD